MEKKQRNGYVDLLRFLASYAIVFFHLGIAPYYTHEGILGKLPSGALFVEFFFLLSGYFAAKPFANTRGNSTPQIHQYMLKKYLHLLPYSLLTTAALYIWILSSRKLTLQDNLKILSMLPFEGFLLRNAGIANVSRLTWFWYLSAMILMLPFLLYLVKYHNHIFRYYLVWVIPLFLYGYLIKIIGTIRTDDWILSNLRALAGMMLGASLVYVTQFIARYHISLTIKSALTVTELSTISAAFYFCHFSSFSKTLYDIVFVLLVYISLAITLSGKSWTSIIHGKVFSFLGKISLPIYCVHTIIFTAVRYFMPHASREAELILTVIGSFVAACIMQAIVDYIILPLAKVVRTKAEACREPELVQSK